MVGQGYPNQFTHSPPDECLHCFQLFKITNNAAGNSFEHYLCTFVQAFQPDTFLEIELLGRSLNSLSVVRCYEIRVTSPSRETCLRLCPSPTPPSPKPKWWHCQWWGIWNPGELLIPLQMHTGPVPGWVNAANKLWGYRFGPTEDPGSERSPRVGQGS